MCKLQLLENNLPEKAERESADSGGALDAITRTAAQTGAIIGHAIVGDMVCCNLYAEE